MFEPSATPRVFSAPPGADFPRDVIAGLHTRLEGRPPEAWADIRILANAGRMLRRLLEVLEDGEARIFPRLSLITDLAALSPFLSAAESVHPLRRELDLARDLERISGLSSRASVARALAALLDEMAEEGVAAEALEALDISDQSGHWQRALAILKIAADFERGPGPGQAARRAAEYLVAQWQARPPATPILVAGSTGSRGVTALIMEAVARLPQGALILPGFDHAMPADVWAELASDAGQEDHPQYRYAALLRRLRLDPTGVEPWNAVPAPRPGRARLLSLALRPAPVTHHWLRDGPDLDDIAEAVERVTLLEASDQKAEANAIALRMRQAAETGETAALITPDRTLTRRVAAALARWKLVADDSAGIPLSLTPPGRLLLQLAQIKAKGIASETLIALLKHPLVASSERGPHLIFTRALELKLRRFGPPFPTPHDITKWADEDEKRRPWGAWLAPIMDGERAATLGAHLAQLRITSERLAAGPGAEGSGALWEEATGRAARGVLESLSNLAEDGDAMDAAAFSAFLAQSLARESVRVPGDAHACLSILGTLEARAQGADVVILGGLNDGIWPQAPTPDPWMNRVLRAKAGLLSPERQVGLSAHDFQQAAMAPEVWMTRATKSEDAETVPSRWLNRITTLLGGLGAQGGPEAVTLMHARGEAWLRDAARLDAAPRVPPAPRPSPVPPPSLRPDTLSVTEIRTLIRDPYAIYAKHILRLRELDPLAQNPDARLRGIVLHDVMEAVLEGLPNEPQAALAHVRDRTAAILARKVPWPAARALWQARLLRAAPWFVATEADRARDRQRLFTEISGEISLDTLPFTLRGKADRIDIAQSGAARVYDYKTGSPPSPAQQRHFDKQLPLEAAMVERGGFGDVGAMAVERAAYIGLGSTPKEADAPLDNDYWAEFETLIAAMYDPDHGFTSRRAVEEDAAPGPYDLLARYGEWGPSDPARKERM